MPRTRRMATAVMMTVLAGASSAVDVSPADAVVPGANGKIAFTSIRGDDEDGRIYVMDPDGSDVVPVSSGQSDEEPAWSPDGTRIAFHSWRTGDLEIFVVNADGSGETQLTTEGGESPTWLPDGRIGFVDHSGPDGEIAVMDPDGTDVQLLTDNDLYDDDPSWSPDGTQIVFHGYREGNDDIYRMNADGSGEKRLTEDSEDDLYPQWSPDGTQIVFRSARDGDDEIFVMDPDGTDQQQVTHNTIEDDTPSWSPDGSMLVFRRTIGTDYEIFTVNVDGSSPVNLSNSPSWDDYPEWQPLTPPAGPPAQTQPVPGPAPTTTAPVTSLRPAAGGTAAASPHFTG